MPGTSLCPVHSGEEAKREYLSALSKKGAEAKRARADDDLTELLRACNFSTLESIEVYLSAMAKLAVEKSDPRFLAGSARVVETCRWYHEAKKWREENIWFHKKYGVKKTPLDGSGD